MLRLITCIALTATLAASAPLSTDRAVLRQAFGGMVASMDTDGDGQLSLDELLPSWRASQPGFGAADFRVEFGALDVDGDGRVSADDFVTAASRPAPAAVVPLSFRSGDADGDGRLPEALAVSVADSLHLADDPARTRYAVHHADADHDGSLDLAEFQHAADALRRGDV